MALYRENPKCQKCGGIILGKYKNQSDLPMEQRIIGDTFLGWDWQNHKCEEKLLQCAVSSSLQLLSAIKEIENAMERWHHARDEDGETLQKINDILVEIGLLGWFNKQ